MVRGEVILAPERFAELRRAAGGVAGLSGGVVCVCGQEREAGEWASRAGELAAAGACPCWCGGWAELHVRSPSGDVSWLLRLQNQVLTHKIRRGSTVSRSKWLCVAWGRACRR